MENAKFRQILSSIVNSSKIPLEKGHTILAIWRDQDHLDQWLNKADSSTDIGLLNVPSEYLPNLEIESSRSEATIIAACLCEKPDYTDLRSVYYMSVMPEEGKDEGEGGGGKDSQPVSTKPQVEEVTEDMPIAEVEADE
ncbi:MAG: hypothetical protein Barrevirus6_9 [Barrevirus sp.]|uniref:Uncharacterized protein n=1 Tax=Barrevirus sp. TaxID=2487763 RepID=A0A3G4ZSJ3_9VIRU|nr:MAG: hypothetical protein Barrevirus6_9 [Barrevirus sp.]